MSDHQHFNDLTPVEHEALSLLLEECAETIAIIGKALRHGLLSCHPDGGHNNQALIETEVGHVEAAVDIAVRCRVLSRASIDAARKEKLARVGRYLHHIALP